MQGQNYMLLDRNNIPLARAWLHSRADADIWQIQIQADKIDQVLAPEAGKNPSEPKVVSLVGMFGDAPALLGRIVRHSGDTIVVEKLRMQGHEQVRENLRVPVSFNSFLYPLDGGWKGRRACQANDLSSGGISFFCGGNLARGEHVEVVIPVTSSPVILPCRILAQRTSQKAGMQFYAAQFTGICHDEETIVREAVFSLQIRQHTRRAAHSSGG